MTRTSRDGTGPRRSRPDRVVVITGTGTDVGKTWVACALINVLRQRGLTVTARKPAQSFAPADATAARTDAHLLAAASGEAPEEVTPPHRWYAVPLAPPMAAEALGRGPFSIAELVEELDAGWANQARVAVVETAGGARSPLADDGDCAAFTRAAGVTDVVVVADAGLGAIHAVRSSADALPRRAIVVLNRFDEADALHARNAEWLRERDGFDVVTSVAALADRLAP